jgi:hypothetical protein
LWPFDLANDEAAVALATKIANAIGKKVVVIEAKCEIIRVISKPQLN